MSGQTRKEFRPVDPADPHAVPTPGTGNRSLFLSSDDGTFSAKSDDDSVVSLEGGGSSALEIAVFSITGRGAGGATNFVMSEVQAQDWVTLVDLGGGTGHRLTVDVPGSYMVYAGIFTNCDAGGDYAIEITSPAVLGAVAAVPKAVDNSQCEAQCMGMVVLGDGDNPNLSPQIAMVSGGFPTGISGQCYVAKLA